ncbi:MAG: tyrosine-type recombinase/integrase [Geobacteraceae bacterium]
MASIQVARLKDGKRRYRVRVRVNGCSRSATFRRKAHADSWASKEEEKAYSSRLSPVEQAQVRLFADAVEKYEREVLKHKARNTERQQRQQLSFWKRMFAERVMADLDSSLIAEAKTVLYPRGNSTINSYLAVLSHLFTMAVKEWKWCPTNPVRDVWRLPEPKERVRFLSSEERAALLFYVKRVPCSVLYPIVVVTLSTGPRKEEIRALEWKYYNNQRGEIYLEETKNKDRRKVRLFGQARELMAQLYRQRDPGARLVFPSQKNPDIPADIRYSWELALERAGIENFCFHDLRHSAASYLAMQGATLTDIKEILGHRTIVTTQKYTHLTDSHTGALVEKMNRAIF